MIVTVVLLVWGSVVRWYLGFSKSSKLLTEKDNPKYETKHIEFTNCLVISILSSKVVYSLDRMSWGLAKSLSQNRLYQYFSARMEAW